MMRANSSRYILSAFVGAALAGCAGSPEPSIAPQSLVSISHAAKVLKDLYVDDTGNGDVEIFSNEPGKRSA